MTPSLIAACLWVLAGTFVAFLPMRLQFPPGLILLVSAPLLLIWVGVEHGFWLTLIGTLAFVSMFRRPLAYFAKRAVSSNREVSE